ncbi:two-component sensor histidine kinase [Streptomyces clavuligerus]|nr:two-component sensor histidine kinase [Streptomyces clavuligerus]AXU11614.1 sensor histidine kinase [Streptomyces clavuligerus]
MHLRALFGSLRVRLTAVFGLMFFLAGAAIFGGALILVGNSMEYTLKLPFPVSAPSPPPASAAGAASPSAGAPPERPAERSPAPSGSPATTPSAPVPWTTSEATPSAVPGEDGPFSGRAPRQWQEQPGGSIVIDEASRDYILASMRENLMTKGGLTVLGVGLAATTMGWLVAGRLLRPLNRITSTAERIAGRTLHRRIDLDGPPGEVKRLADSFDSMLDRLDQAFAGQDRFIANAAHELKTPLAVGRTLVEVAVARPAAPPELRQLGENLLAVNERHERLIDSLLTLARAESTITGRLPVDLAQIADAVLEQTREGAERQGLTVESALRPAPATGDPVLLEQLVRNLIDNAVKYNRPGGLLRVETGAGRDGAHVTVLNTGAEIRSHEIPVLFEPFRRLTDRVGSARGSGLGLSIVRAVARTHNGDVTAVPRPGGGLGVTATLPRG